VTDAELQLFERATRLERKDARRLVAEVRRLTDMLDESARAHDLKDAQLATARAEALKSAHAIAMEAWEYHNDPKTEQREAFGDGARGVALRIATRIVELNATTPTAIGTGSNAGSKPTPAATCARCGARLPDSMECDCVGRR